MAIRKPAGSGKLMNQFKGQRVVEKKVPVVVADHQTGGAWVEVEAQKVAARIGPGNGKPGGSGDHRVSFQSALNVRRNDHRVGARIRPS